MMLKRQHLIYGLVDPETNELRYVGKSSNGIIRAHRRHSCHCENWRQSLKRRGMRPIVITIENLDEYNDTLNERERFWIEYHRSQGAPLTNLTVGGDGYVLSPEHRAKLLAANTGRPCSSETRAKISAANRGKKRTPEQCAKISDSHRGLKASKKTKVRMSRTRKGRPLSETHVEALRATWHEHHTEETFEKIATSKRGKPRDAATKAKVSASLKGRPWSTARRAAQRSKDPHQSVIRPIEQ